MDGQLRLLRSRSRSFAGSIVLNVIILDVCCLNRPFDDQNQDRIRLEAEAVLVILNRIHLRSWQLIGSEVIDFEIGQSRDPQRADRLRQVAGMANRVVRVGETEVQRSEQIEEMGFREFDALHLAGAESGGADVFLSTNDRPLRLARRAAAKLGFHVANPLEWISEVMKK